LRDLAMEDLLPEPSSLLSRVDLFLLIPASRTLRAAVIQVKDSADQSILNVPQLIPAEPAARSLPLEESVLSSTPSPMLPLLNMELLLAPII